MATSLEGINAVSYFKNNMTEEEKTPIDIQVIEIRYRGFEIRYSEYFEEYCSVVDKNVVNKKSLKECKKRIDDLLKVEKEFKPFPAFFKESSLRAETKFHKVIVTSGTPVEVWIKDDNGKRSKVETERVYQDTEHNRAVIDWIKKNDQAVKEAREAKEELIKSLINIQL